MAQALGLGAALWSPLGGGLLTGKYRQGATGRISELKALGFYEDSPLKTAIVDAVLDVAAELGVPASHVAIAWMRQQGAQAATAYVPIIGPRSLAQLDDYLDALDPNADSVGERPPRPGQRDQARHAARAERVERGPHPRR
jgi:aryl-alcohol dehydrogenase-like predicted oxidoreductase